MRRRHSPAELNLLKRWKAVKDRYIPGSRFPVSRKKHPLDCGTPGCLCCHGMKRYRREPTRQELRADDPAA